MGSAQLADDNFGVSGFATGGGWTYGVRGKAEAPTDNLDQGAIGVHGMAVCEEGSSVCTKYAVFATGDLVWTGSHYHYSDLRLKESLEPLERALPSLLELEVVSYEHLKSEEVAHMNLARGPQVGFVAQQVAQVLPNLVVEAVHPPAEGPRDEGPASEPIRYQALKTIDLIPYLVRAIQEQQAEIEALEAELRPWRARRSEPQEESQADDGQMQPAL